MAIQRDGRWESVPLALEESPAGIRTIGSDKTLVPLTFTAPEGTCDERLRGYLNVRIGAAMVVGDEVRRAKGWGDKAMVPLWIAMPSH